MACMSHDCGKCGHMWFNNSSAWSCPKCGSSDVGSFYDEADMECIEVDADDEDWGEEE